MALTAGTRLGVFELAELLGRGGMGEVYRATDTKLKRQVAIKVLPASMAADRDRLARFQREAEVLASLNHPNIAAIYGLEESDGIIALVMELVEGDDLSKRIARLRAPGASAGQAGMPLDEALPIAKQIAEALEAAHEQGIIHRDLKPANIKVRSDGTVKVLDFGLAKALAPAGSKDPAYEDLTQSPTLTTPAMTEAGMILGTAAYMSPEQARGKPVDKRADIWAFGVVLWEMLTGKRLFEAATISDTLAAVLTREPDWTALPAGTPTPILRLLRRCLEKDRKRRLTDAGAARLEIDDALTSASAVDGATASAATSPQAGSRTRVFVAVAVSGLAGALVAAAALWPWAGGQSPGSEAPTRTSVMVPANRPLWIGEYPTRSLALSPDGTQFVYVGTNLEVSTAQPGGRTQLQLRSLDTLTVRDLPGTAGAGQPFFSPDGQWVGFFTEAGELKKISLAGGDPITLLSKINGGGFAFGLWTDDGAIIFGTISSGLRLVSAEGGTASDLTSLDVAQHETSHFFPALVPSSRAVLFSVRARASGFHRIDAVMLDSGERRVVVEDAYAPLVLSNGHLLFQRDDAILIAAFDSARLAVTGPAVPLLGKVRRDTPLSPFPAAELAVSRTGTLAYVPAADIASTLALVRRDGTFERLGPPSSNVYLPRVSPDGRAIAFNVGLGPVSEIHVYDLLRGSTTKLTQDEYSYWAAWHPDGRSLAIFSRREGTAGIFLKNLDGTERLLVPLPAGATVLRNASWSPDGTRLAYTVQAGTLHDIWVLTMGETPTTKPLLTNAASEHSPAFSPDGRWLAYASDESGRFEVYVQQYPQGERIAVSIGGGLDPVWRRDGKEIHFIGADAGVEKMMAVAVTSDRTLLRLGKPVPLFELRAPGSAGANEQYEDGGNKGAGYDILPDGRFVMVRGADLTGAREIVIVQHWFEELKRRVPTK